MEKMNQKYNHGSMIIWDVQVQKHSQHFGKQYELLKLVACLEWPPMPIQGKKNQTQDYEVEPNPNLIRTPPFIIDVIEEQ